jgi:hypothetical protein
MHELAGIHFVGSSSSVADWDDVLYAPGMIVDVQPSGAKRSLSNLDSSLQRTLVLGHALDVMLIAIRPQHLPLQSEKHTQMQAMRRTIRLHLSQSMVCASSQLSADRRELSECGRACKKCYNCVCSSSVFVEVLQGFSIAAKLDCGVVARVA